MNFELKTQFAFEPSFGAGDCRRDQRWLEAHTLFVTYIRVRDKAVWGGSWRLGSWMRVREVGKVEIWVENTVCCLNPTMT